MGRLLHRIPWRAVAVWTLVVALYVLGGWLALQAIKTGTGDNGLGIASVAALLAATSLPLAARVLGHERVRLPRTVAGRELLPDTALRLRMALVVALALGLPLAAILAPAVLLRPGGWLISDAVVLVIAFGAAFGASIAERATHVETTPPAVSAVLQRLCVRADVAVPPLVVHDTGAATAWAEDGRIHVTRGLEAQLSPAELEGVLAHELTHLARGDALVMDVVTAPSRHLLGGIRATPFVILEDFRAGLLAIAVGLLLLVPALVLAAVNRLLSAVLSRGRELSADATAATLTGNPSALAAALLKLNGAAAPTGDLRSRSAMSIVALRAGWFAPLRTHPPVAKRVERLQAMEHRLQDPLAR